MREGGSAPRGKLYTRIDERDLTKDEQALSVETEELKRRRNFDLEEIKLMRVELQKLELIYRKHKDMNREIGDVVNAERILLPGVRELQINKQELATATQQMSKEELLAEVARVKRRAIVSHGETSFGGVR